MQRLLGEIAVLVLGAMCCNVALGGAGKTGSKSASSTTSGAAPAAAASAPASTTGDLSTWLAYVAAQRAINSALSQIPTNRCPHLTTVSIHDRMAAQILSTNVVQQPGVMLGQLCLARGKFESDEAKKEREAAEAVNPDDGDPCKGLPQQHAFFPAATGIGTAITALSGALSLVQSFVPTYTPTTSSETIDATAMQRMLQSADSRFLYPSYTSVDFAAVTFPLTKLSKVSNYISLQPTPTQASLATFQQSIVKAASDLIQSFDTQSVLDARAINSIDAKACSVDVSVAAAASSTVAKKTFFTSNEVFESGLATVSYDAQLMTGEHVTQGVLSVGCELKDAYKLGTGQPPGLNDPKTVACSNDPK